MEPEEGMLAEAGGNSVPSQGNCAGSEGESQTPQKGKLAEGKLEQKRSPRKKRKNIPTLTTTVRRRTSLKKARRKSSWTAEASNGMRRKTRREILSESRQRIVGGARDGSLPAARAAAGSLHKAGRAAAGRLQTASNGNGTAGAGPSGKSGMPVRGGLIPIPPGGIGLGEASSSPSRTDTKTSS